MPVLTQRNEIEYVLDLAQEARHQADLVLDSQDAVNTPMQLKALAHSQACLAEAVRLLASRLDLPDDGR